MTVLVIAEHDNTSIKAATLNAIGAASQLGAEVHVMVAGSNLQDAVDGASKIVGVAKVLVADATQLAEGLAENVADTVCAVAHAYTHIFAPATAFGKNIAPRVAALLDVAQISEITRVIDGETFERPIYAGNAIATVQSIDAIKVITVRSTAFSPALVAGGEASVEYVDAGNARGGSQLVSRELSHFDRPELTSAKVVVSGGRGLASSENYATLLEPLADKLGAALGASRAAVDLGYASNDFQVGQTGKIVAPDLYIAVGISGAIQHLAGMKDSRTIVAINKDPEAPIFGVSDYFVVGDLFSVVPELIAQI
jgi:electron transfer flavoprotein alpha subunit